MYQGGPAPRPLESANVDCSDQIDGMDPMPRVSADVDCSDQVDTLDLVYLIDYILNGGPPPCP